MYYYAKKIDQNKLKKIKSIVDNLSNIPNTVPSELKKSFSFKGRKSISIAEKIISIISDKNDLVCDPFIGGGSFLIAALSAKRKFIGSELDNYTYDVISSLITKMNIKKIKTLFNNVKAKVKDDIMSLYSTSCCGNDNYIKKLLYDPQDNEYFNPKPNREIKNGKNVILMHTCPVCNEKRKSFSNDDLAQITKTNKINTEDFPNHKYIENSRINITSSRGADYYDKIFTNRNKVALLLIQNAILDLPEGIERDILEHVLVSSLTLSRISMYGSSSDILYHVVPYQAQEMNVWDIFEEKYNNFLKFKHKYKSIQQENLDNSDIHIINDDYRALLTNHKYQGKVGLIYTDFPYTDQVPFLERNQLYRDWLNKFYYRSKFSLSKEMLDAEIIQTNAPSRAQKHSLEQYYSDLDEMFSIFYKSLKNDGTLALTLKLGQNKYLKTFFEIINLARKNGFEFLYKMSLDKNDPTLRKQSAYKNTISNEIIVFFSKLDEGNRYWYIGNNNAEFEISKFIYKMLETADSPLTQSKVINEVSNYLLIKHGIVSTYSTHIKIKNLLNSRFKVEQDKSLVFIDSNKLYLDIEDNTDLFTKLYDIIPVFIKKLLEEKSSFVIEDLYFEIINAMGDGKSNAIQLFIEDENSQNQITNLIENYCDINENAYIAKKKPKNAQKGAIDISTLTGTEFEILMKSILEMDGYFNVIQIGGAGDLGVDLMAKKQNIAGKPETYLFQCKRWISNVGSTPIQRLHSMRIIRNVEHAACITTSHYTKDAMLIADKTDVKLINGNDVILKLNKAFPNKYYNGTN